MRTSGCYFEDLEPGRVFRTAGATLTEDAIVRFGLEWDFQPFHVDREAAKESLFGGLCASGLHTLALSFRLCNQCGLFTGTALAGLGFDGIRFLKPVRPGDTIRVEVTVSSMRHSASRPGTGIVKWHVRTNNQQGDAVLKLDITNIVAMRAGTSRDISSAGPA